MKSLRYNNLRVLPAFSLLLPNFWALLPMEDTLLLNLKQILFFEGGKKMETLSCSLISLSSHKFTPQIDTDYVTTNYAE